MLNERAAIAGELHKAELRHQAISSNLASLQRQMDRVALKLALVANTLAARQATMKALDTAIGLMHSRADPCAGGVVQAMNGKYGERGALKRFVTKSLINAAPAPVATSMLITMAIAHFGLALLCPDDRRSLNNSIKGVINTLRLKNAVEPVHAGPMANTGLWLWKRPVTLADLAAQVAKAAAEPPDVGPTHSNPS